jgi:hypothetical protein
MVWDLDEGDFVKTDAAATPVGLRFTSDNPISDVLAKRVLSAPFKGIRFVPYIPPNRGYFGTIISFG